MRTRYSALIILLATSVVPSVALAQVLTPFAPHKHQSLDHVVPVATVNLVGDMVGLADPVVVQAPPGEPFVLGAATLDLRDPSHATIVFAMTNASGVPVPWNTVELDVRRVTSVPGTDKLFFGCELSGLAGHEGTWQPGTRVTVQVPIAPNDNCLKLQPSEPQGFLVYAGRVLPHSDQSAWPSGLFRRAYEKLTSSAR